MIALQLSFMVFLEQFFCLFTYLLKFCSIEIKIFISYTSLFLYEQFYEKTPLQECNSRK